MAITDKHMKDARRTLGTFTLENLPDLDTAVCGALSLIQAAQLPSPPAPALSHPLVIGSGNAATTGQILFKDVPDVVCATESDVDSYLQTPERFECAVLISASGGKHATEIAHKLRECGLARFLYTNNPEAPARPYFPEENVYVFPKNREPYTYNTSTYFSMVAAHEPSFQADSLHAFLANEVIPALEQNTHIRASRGFTFLLPPAVRVIIPMLRTKFDELFGIELTGRFFTLEEAKHAKTVVPSAEECFISLGVTNEYFGHPSQRHHIAMPATHQDILSYLAAAYAVIGVIQRTHPPYFKRHIQAYADTASQIFGETITPIVE